MTRTVMPVEFEPRRRSVVVAVTAIVAAVLVIPLALVAGSDTAAAAAKVQRVAGHDRYDTAAQLSRQTFSPGVPAAFVATGATFPDGLSGAPAAAASHGPVLLTKPHSLPYVTDEELNRLQPQRIVVLGGQGAVSNHVVDQLRSDTSGRVTRVSGSNGYATAAAVSKATFSPGVVAAYVATGESFADALAGGAAAGWKHSPVLLTKHNSLPTATQHELQRLHPASIRILGGHGAVSDAVKSQLASYTSGNVSRLSGHDRYATSAAVSKATFSAQSAKVAYLATGSNFPDALGGGAAGAYSPGPVLLAKHGCVPATVSAEIARLHPATVVLLGGEGALGKGVEELKSCDTGTLLLDPDGRDRYVVDRNVDFGDYSINGKEFRFSAKNPSNKNIVGHPRYLDFDLSRKFKTFTARLGVADDSDAKGTSEIRLYLDGQKVFDKTLSLGQSKDVSLNVSNVLRVRVTFLNASGAHGAIGDPAVQGRSAGVGPGPGPVGGQTLLLDPDDRDRYVVDRNVDFGDYSINGKEFRFSAKNPSNKNVVGHPRYLDFDLSRKFKTFTARLGVADDSDAKGTSEIRLYLDGQKVFDKTLSLGQSKDVSLNVSNVLRVRFTFLNASGAHGAIGDPAVTGS